MQLAEQYPDLSKVFGENSLVGGYQGLAQIAAAQAAQQQNLSQAQQDYDFNQQLQPGNVALQSANVAHTQNLADLTKAQIPGAAAKSDMDARANTVDASIPLEQKKQAAMGQLAKQISADQLAQIENHAWAGMQDPDPKVRAQAQQAILMTKAVKEKQLELQQQGENSARVANIGADATKYAADARVRAAQAANELKGRVAGMKMTYQQQAGFYTQAALKAGNAADDPSLSDEDKQQLLATKQQYLDLAEQAKNEDLNARTAAAQTGLIPKLDIPAVAGMPGAANAPGGRSIPTPSPLAASTAPSPTQTGTVLMKDKSGVLHTVPAANAAKARAAGWTGGEQVPGQIPN